MAVLLACITAGLVFLIDQASKARALAAASHDPSGFIRLRCIVNKGGLVGILPGPWLIMAWLLCMAAAVVAVLQPFAAKPVAAVGIGMVAGGVTGNFRDLQRRRGVVDFIAVGSFTIFNLADCAIASGIALAFWAVF
jgi:signal peptidase II